MSNELKICIVGLGGIGRLYLKVLRRLDGARVVSIVSNSITEDEACSNGLKVYRSINAMLSDSRPDVCCVCTPSYLHYQQIKELLSAGVNVIAEKPLCLNPQDAEQLFEIEKQQNDTRLFVAQVVRFSYPSCLLKEWVFSGTYGRVLDASFSRLSVKPYWCSNLWVFDKNMSGHIPYDLHIHDLDLIINLFGIPGEAKYIACGSGNKVYDEHCRFLYTYPGFHVLAEAAWFDANIPFKVLWRVSFERAVIECTGEHVTVYQPGGKELHFEPHDAVGDDSGINVPASGMYVRELTHFLTCIRENRSSDIVRNEEVITVLQILAKMMGKNKAISSFTHQ